MHGMRPRGAHQHPLLPPRSHQKHTIRAVIGGFHLLTAGEERLQATVVALKELAPQTLVPCHCTGESAMRRLCDDLGESVTPGAAGMTFWY